MISRTKYKLDESALLRLLEQAGFPGVSRAVPLGDGEFNAVFLASAPEKNYVVKIAPPGSVPVMSYETGMMQSEAYWYGVMRDRTRIRVPMVYCADFSCERLPVSYLIMEYLEGEPLNRAILSEAERAEANALLAQMAAQLHAVRGERFGYLQNGLFDRWPDAMEAMIQRLLDDCAERKRRSRRGERLLRFVRQYREILDQAPCRMVNFDIWPANILVSREDGALRLAWIDPERSFWGDPMLDFVCFAFHRQLREIPATISAYNAVAEQPVTPTQQETIRFAIGQGYLALIMETEKYFRYSPVRFGWWRNVFACRLLYSAAFGALGGR